MEKQCEYNFGCEDYAEDGSWKGWSEWHDNPAPAKHHFEFEDKEQDCVFEYDLCDGCLASLESSCEFDDNLEEMVNKRIAPQTKSYEGQRSSRKKGTWIVQCWTMEDYRSSIRQLHRTCKKHEGKRCTEECYDRDEINEKHVQVDRIHGENNV